MAQHLRYLKPNDGDGRPEHKETDTMNRHIPLHTMQSSLDATVQTSAVECWTGLVGLRRGAS